jgi:GNAT superfamily N-acetyltransferase
MEKSIYSNIKEQIIKYKFFSLKFTEYEDILNYEVLCCDEKVILIFGYNVEMGLYEFHWAADNSVDLLKKIKESQKKGIITFIPEEWVKEFKNNNFHIYARWNDYFNNDISKIFQPEEVIEFLQEVECREASEVTLACRGQSRGFAGQSEGWMQLWIKGEEPNLIASGGKDSAILVHREKQCVAGIICVTIYGHEREKGATLWIREVAVLPQYQKRGIAEKLLRQALFYGKGHGAKRAFLMADECNEHAIKLYEKVGFSANKDDSEIDMILN